MSLECVQSMDPVVFEDSPLATYLEGEGERDQEWAHVEAEQQQPLHTSSFAPHGSSTLRARLRNHFAVPHPLQVPEYHGPMSRLHSACSSAVTSGIGRGENARFLEQFRYPIVASQLLNDHTAFTFPKAGTSLPGVLNPLDASVDLTSAPHSVHGAFVTAFVAFLIVWLVHRTKAEDGSFLTSRNFWVASITFATVGTILFIYARRRWVEYLRHQAIDASVTLISKAQAFDATALSALSLIQEVELVSRGYNLSSPLPPISRLEEASQARFCSRLRRHLFKSLKDIVSRYSAAHRVLQPLVEHADLERYYDIYELSRSELQEIDIDGFECDLEDAESLKSLKSILSRLHSARKIVFCCLLALESNGGPAEYAKWSSAVVEMQALAAVTSTCTKTFSDLLAEDDHPAFTEYPTKSPLAATDQRAKAQLRRLNSLSQGIRALHAKIHVLREESEGNIEPIDDESTVSRTLASQYDSVGVDLRALLQEWEVGKAALSLNSDRSKRFSSQSSSGIRSPMSPTFSLGGQTAVGGSPSDALRILNGDEVPQATIDASDEEVFEAIAFPRKRSSMTREERIAKMKEDRVRQSIAREKSDANTHMLKELETVMKHRPRGRTTSRMTHNEYLSPTQA